MRHQASNIYVVAERDDELDVESYLFVTQIIERKPSTLSSGLVHWTLRLTADGYRVLYKDVVLDSIESDRVRSRSPRWPIGSSGGDRQR